VFAGETLTAVPLDAAMFPGVMTPVPLAKIPVRCADPPAVTVVGLAVKLVIAGSEEEDPPRNELHPVRMARGRHRTNVQRANTVTRIVAPFVTKAIERISVRQNWNNSIRSSCSFNHLILLAGLYLSHKGNVKNLGSIGA
jgi:hypothetical protein